MQQPLDRTFIHRERRGSIAAFLHGADIACTMSGLPHHWRHATLAVTCARPKAFEGGEWFPAALRGAWGRQLAERASSGRDMAPFEIFFRGLGGLGAGRSIPAPFSVRVDENGAVLHIALTLHGIADRWREPSFDAFIAALEHGVAIRPLSTLRRVSFEIVNTAWSRAERFSVPIATGPAWLQFQTPVRLGARRSVRAHWPDLIVSLADRLSRLARWQGLLVSSDLGEWRRRAESLKFDDRHMRPVTWGRRSGAQGGKFVPMVGLIGTLGVASVPEDLLPLLALGQLVHVGGHTALGLGRYELL